MTHSRDTPQHPLNLSQRPGLSAERTAARFNVLVVGREQPHLRY
jgi:hypothetical protein